MDARDWDERYAATDRLWSSGPNETVRALLWDEPPGRALDLACGEGRNALWLAERGGDVLGVDFSQVAVDRASGLAGERGLAARFERGDLTEWTPARADRDLVLFAYLQVPDELRRRALTAGATALAPGGRLIWLAHDIDNLTRGYGGPQQPAVLSTPEAIVDALAGLEIERAERITRTVTTDAGPREAIDTLVIGHRPT